MDIRSISEKYKSRVIELRRQIHRHPELGLQEYDTTKLVVSELEKLGITYRLLEPTGVIAEIHGKSGGKTVALRADMDALPITEQTDVEWKSQNVGVMHACGHDTHTAMLLGAAMILSEIKDELCGTVRLIFQPAEETGKGAVAVIAQGGFENVDMAFGIYIISPMPLNTVMVSNGPSHASSGNFKITVTGKGAHAASPHQGRDPIIAASQLVCALASVAAKELDPLEPFVLNVCSIHAGTANNIIPNTAEISGTVRTTTVATQQRVPDILKRHAEGVAASFGCTADVEYDSVTSVVDNAPAASDIALGAAAKVSDGKVIRKGLRTLGGEDFGAYTTLAPSTFISLGSAGVGPMHGDHFDPDESCFVTGSALYAQCAVDALRELSGE